MSTKQKFTGKTSKEIKGPVSPAGVPAVDSQVTSHQVMASKGITNMRRQSAHK